MVFRFIVVCIPITGFVYGSALLKSILSNTVDLFNGLRPKPKIRLQFVNFIDFRLFFASITTNTFFKSSSDMDQLGLGTTLCISIQSNVSHVLRQSSLCADKIDDDMDLFDNDTRDTTSHFDLGSSAAANS